MELPELPEPSIIDRHLPTGYVIRGYTAKDMRAYAAAAVEAERAQWMELACDGWAVLQGLDARAQARTSHENVSDTLDALVRTIRARSAPRTQEG